ISITARATTSFGANAAGAGPRWAASSRRSRATRHGGPRTAFPGGREPGPRFSRAGTFSRGVQKATMIGLLKNRVAGCPTRLPKERQGKRNDLVENFHDVGGGKTRDKIGAAWLLLSIGTGRRCSPAAMLCELLMRDGHPVPVLVTGEEMIGGST